MNRNLIFDLLNCTGDSTEIRKRAADELARMDAQLDRQQRCIQKMRELAAEARTKPVGNVDGYLSNIILISSRP